LLLQIVIAICTSASWSKKKSAGSALSQQQEQQEQSQQSWYSLTPQDPQEYQLGKNARK
jgi:hypothetical protein